MKSEKKPLTKEQIRQLENSAGRGDVSAAEKLSFLYGDAQSGVKDPQKAFEWRLKAAEMGSRTAAFWLAFDYADGKDTVQDLDKATHWLNVAKSRGMGDLSTLEQNIESKRRVNSKLVADNKETLALLENFRKEQSTEALRLLVNQLLKASFLLPVVFDQENLTIAIVENSNHIKLMPVFTDLSRLPAKDKFSYSSTASRNFISILSMIEDQKVEVDGLVVNMAHENVILRKDLMTAVTRFLGEQVKKKKPETEISKERFEQMMSESVEVKNHSLEVAIAAYQQTQSRDNLVVLLDELRHAKVLIPAAKDPQQRVIPLTLTDRDKQALMPVFSDKVRLSKAPRCEAVINMDFKDSVKMAIAPGSPIVGIVINPFDSSIMLRKEILELFLEVDNTAK